ncbi:FAD-dependent thymidylate synthase [Candidatus Micrarchaeota archaeon]|nr:FAD-dependent thymidylate synthase [Candidatus Micrarchaeota archaeon]
MPSEFSQQEQSVLAPYFTNLDRDVFALRNLPEVVKGALFSRYSRTNKSLRRVLYDEFINDKDMAFDQIVSAPKQDETVAIKKAEEFYDRVLVGYGDDSVAELGGAHIAVENVSNIVTKVLQDSRLGISPLEKSTRYVYFNEKDVAGKYRYYREPELMAADARAYESACDGLFDAYSKLLDPMTAYFKERFPQGDASERAYASAIRAKTCDSLRGLLPAGTLTNVGMYGNGRAFDYLLLKMYASPLSEARAVAASMQTELSQVIPSFVKRANDKYGQATQGFQKAARAQVAPFAARLPESRQMVEVALTNFDADAEEKIVAAILYEALPSHTDLRSLNAHVRLMPSDTKAQILDAYCGHRQNRRQKPGRAFENATYTFSIRANYGAYRDLQRHRVLTQQRQLLCTQHGFDLPPEILDAGFQSQFTDAVQTAAAVFESFQKDHAVAAQYVVPMAFKLQWYVTMNLREAFHLIELRSMEQGHADYRRVAQHMYYEINRVQPRLAKYMTFVDFKDYGLERLSSEKKIDQKLEQVKEKYG